MGLKEIKKKYIVSVTIMHQFYIDIKKLVCNKDNIFIFKFEHKPEIQKDSWNLKSNFYNLNNLFLIFRKWEICSKIP